ncbi:recombination regulator RecX [Vibrio breoganii]|uniref:Regulatory protein RecX n=1 Tax=Vibrio breoganii TaxID=553239 RepID=A0AAP8SXL7_9VIBR|nr:recombination regulator RecX [Vibrio breoganii]OCH74854.1 recombination regulator RecX [Vibrio breoganii]OED98288.1 recombination regulator RecX [Vibrio breoganii ZF-29]OEF81135.1 recombination regulator RecX [Vibrio breoganii 1C10]PMG34921.1 recombination regulator RecX [Vibrio breoganii]PML30857.1 recombination regulator RecX [Vibrio breoganii]
MYSLTPTWTAKKTALDLLSRCEYGRYELQQKLLNKGFELSDIDEAVEFCREHHYLDDLRYAKDQIKQHVEKGHGERRIRQNLHVKHVRSEVIDQALAEEPQNWFELAKLSVKKYLETNPSCESHEHSKQVRFLQYRGFSPEQIQYALNPE